MIDAGLNTFLIAVAGVGTRVYPDILPERGETPAVSYAQINIAPEYALSGAVPLAEYWFQVDCWARTRSEAKTVANAIRVALSGYRGALGDDDCQHALLIAEQSFYEDTPKLYRVSQDWKFMVVIE